MTKTVEQIRAMLDAQDARAKERRDKVKDNYMYRRMRDMPEMLEAARKKLAMLQVEASSYRLDEYTGLPEKRNVA